MIIIIPQGVSSPAVRQLRTVRLESSQRMRIQPVQPRRHAESLRDHDEVTAVSKVLDSAGIMVPASRRVCREGGDNITARFVRPKKRA